MSKSVISPSSSIIQHVSQTNSQTKSTSLEKHHLLEPTTNVISLISTNSKFIKIYNNIHTIIIPIYYFLIRSTSLVSNPSDTMIKDLPIIILLQGIFVASCLPKYGEWNSGNGSIPIKGKKKSKNVNESINTNMISGGKGLTKKLIPTILSISLSLLLPPIPLIILASCMGAPLFPTELIGHTLLLSVHLSLLSFLPIFYTHGVSATAWKDVSCAWLPFDEVGVWGGTVGSFVGGWIGAVPIALDWDREWQKWPVTVLWGIVAGWTLGRIFTGILGWGVGKRIDLSENTYPDIGSGYSKEVAKKTN